MNQDRIFSEPLDHVDRFEFDDAVANVFPDMIARSVPGYASMLAMIELITQTFAISGSQLYDLGCSLGAATLRMRQQAPKSCTLHAVDSSSAMMMRLRETLADHGDCCETILHENDIRDVKVDDASVVVLNLTLQFLPVADRSALLQSIADGMRHDGVLVLSEKIAFDDPAEQTLMIDLHHSFKRAHGYSELEIAQKRTALENRLVPETLETHFARLRDCGFRDASMWFQCFNFVSILARR